MTGETIDSVIIGLGINLNFHTQQLTSDLHATSTTIQDETKRETDRDELVKKILAQLDSNYKGFLDSPEGVIDVWKASASTLGQIVRIETEQGEHTGKATDLDPFGGLIIETGDGFVTVYEGDCLHLEEQ